jgi:two-component system response regulator HupR/HoxA
MNQYKMLLVDDSPNILKALLRSFKDEGYKIFTAGSAKEALDQLTRESVDLIISDQNMPEISGIDLLKLVRLKYPKIIRMMLTGTTDFEVAKEAINKGEIYRFFNKPCDDFELLLSVKYALKNKCLEEENNKLKNALSEKEEKLKQLESKYPGITKRERTSDGAFVIENGQ